MKQYIGLRDLFQRIGPEGVGEYLISLAGFLYFNTSRMYTHLVHSHHLVIPLTVIHVNGEVRPCKFTDTGIVSCILRPLTITYNCLHIPHGEAAGVMFVATAKALNDLCPATCYSSVSVLQSLQPQPTTAVPKATRSAQVPTG